MSEVRLQGKVDIPVQVLYPFRINITVEYDPMPLATFTTHVVNDLSQDMGEETIIPFSCSWIQGSIESIFVHGLRVNNIGNPFDTIQSFQSGKEDLPGIGLPTSRGTNHHQTMLNLLDLIQLENLGNPLLASDQTLLRTDGENLLLQSLEVHWEVVHTREDIGKEAGREGQSSASGRRTT
jgi:hypothetical protein